MSITFRAQRPANWDAVVTESLFETKHPRKIDSFAKNFFTDRPDFTEETSQRIMKEWAKERMLPAVTLHEKGKLQQQRDEMFERFEPRLERVQFETADGVELDGVIVKYHEMSPWIIYYVGNADAYEHNIELGIMIADSAYCNVLLFNYRGVGESSGSAEQALDLVLDGDAAYQFIRIGGTLPERIMIHGHSLGALVGTKVRALHPQGPLCVDRAMSSWKALEEGRDAIQGPDIGKMMRSVNWDLKILKDWKRVQGRKWMIVSMEDDIVKFETASFYKAVKGRVQAIFLPEKTLRGTHTIALPLLVEVWHAHMKQMQKAFEIPNKAV